MRSASAAASPVGTRIPVSPSSMSVEPPSPVEARHEDSHPVRHRVVQNGRGEDYE